VVASGQGANTTYQVGSSTASGPSLFVSSDSAYLTWYYSNSSVTPVTSTPVNAGDVTTTTTAVNFPSQSTVEGWAQPWLAKAVGDKSVGRPTFNQWPVDGDSVSYVDYPIQINGHDIGQSFSFGFNGDGTLVSASGVETTITQLGIFPLLSPSAAVAVLQSQQGQGFGWTRSARRATPSAKCP
jgi:hypothetical protein